METMTAGKTLPAADRMYAALVDRDASYLGVFVACVRTTGIFCLPTCRAKKPRAENVEFAVDAAAAVRAGFRPCKVCRPLEPPGALPDWMQLLVDEIAAAPDARVTSADLRGRGLEPARVRRAFQSHFGTTFHAWQRAWRVGAAMKELRAGRPVVEAGLAGGFESARGFRDAFRRLFGESPAEGRTAQALVARWLETPLGPMVAVGSGAGVVLLEFVDRRALETQVATVRRRFGAPVLPGTNEHVDALERQLGAYFEGERRDFTVPLDLPGSPFQVEVWKALRDIPHGETRSYAELAQSIGRPGASRAVGRANGENRVAIVVPCHRVIGADGTLTGYGGGLERKRWLLEHESRPGA